MRKHHAQVSRYELHWILSFFLKIRMNAKTDHVGSIYTHEPPVLQAIGVAIFHQPGHCVASRTRQRAHEISLRFHIGESRNRVHTHGFRDLPRPVPNSWRDRTRVSLNITSCASSYRKKKYAGLACCHGIGIPRHQLWLNPIHKLRELEEIIRRTTKGDPSTPAADAAQLHNSKARLHQLTLRSVKR